MIAGVAMREEAAAAFALVLGVLTFARSPTSPSSSGRSWPSGSSTFRRRLLLLAGNVLAGDHGEARRARGGPALGLGILALAGIRLAGPISPGRMTHTLAAAYDAHGASACSGTSRSNTPNAAAPRMPAASSSGLSRSPGFRVLVENARRVHLKQGTWPAQNGTSGSLARTRRRLAWLQLAVVREKAATWLAPRRLREPGARPGLLAAHLRLASVLARKGDRDGARREIQAVLAADPGRGGCRGLAGP